MIYRSVLVLFSMLTGGFAAEGDVLCGDASVIRKGACHAGCGGNCQFQKPRKIKKQKANLSAATSNDVRDVSKSLPLTFHQSASLPQQEPVVSSMSSDASKPVVLTSVFDTNETKPNSPVMVFVAQQEALPVQTDAGSVKVDVSEKPEEQSNLSIAEQDPRTKLHHEDAVTDVEGEEISSEKPTELIVVESDKASKSKTKKIHFLEKLKTDDYETDKEEDDEAEDEEDEESEGSSKSKLVKFTKGSESKRKKT